MQNYYCPSYFHKTEFGTPDKITHHTDHSYLLENSEYDDESSEDLSVFHSSNPLFNLQKDQMQYSNLELGFNSENYCPNYDKSFPADRKKMEQAPEDPNEGQESASENFFDHETDTAPTKQDFLLEDRGEMRLEPPKSRKSSQFSGTPQNENFPNILHKKIMKQSKLSGSHFPKKLKAALPNTHNKYSKPFPGDQKAKDYISFCPGNNFFLPGEPPKRSYIKKNAYPTYSELSKLMNYLLDLDWSDNRIFKAKLFTPNVYWFILCFLYFPRNAFARKNIREFIHYRFQKLNDIQFNITQRIQKEQFQPDIVEKTPSERLSKFIQAAKFYNENIRTNDYLQKISCSRAMKATPKPNYTTQDDEWIIETKAFILKNYKTLLDNGYLGVENNIETSLDWLSRIDLQDLISLYERSLYRVKSKSEKRLHNLENQVHKILETESHLFKNDFEANDSIVDLAMRFPEEENFLRLLEEQQNSPDELETTESHPMIQASTSLSRELVDHSYHIERICDICNEGDIEGDSMITCMGCGIDVHLFCYGLNSVISSEWSCDLCSQFGENGKLLRCPCCPIRGGAMKKSVLKSNTTIFKDTNPSFHDYLHHEEPKPQDVWVHITCALFIPSLYFRDSKNVNQIAGLENIHKKDFLQKCQVCNLNKVGVALNCIRPGCKRRFHVECGRRAGYYLDFVEDEHSKGEYNIYCSQHTPLKVQKKLDSKENAMRIEIERFFQAVQKSVLEVKQTPKLSEKNPETLDVFQQKENYTENKIRKQKDDANYFMKLVHKYKEKYPQNPITITLENSDLGEFKITEINAPMSVEGFNSKEKIRPDDYIWQVMPYKSLSAEEKYQKYYGIILKKEKKAHHHHHGKTKTYSKRSSSSSAQDHILYCTCQKPYSGEVMIACENCGGWFHPKCVGISRTVNLEKLIWSCPNCMKNTEDEVLSNPRRKRLKT